MVRRRAILYLSLILFFIVSCAGANFRWDDARKLKIGMSKQEVESIMGGPPTRKTAVQLSEGLKETYIWSYAQAFMQLKSKAVSVVFLNGKAVSVPPIPEDYKD